MSCNRFDCIPSYILSITQTFRELNQKKRFKEDVLKQEWKSLGSLSLLVCWSTGLVCYSGLRHSSTNIIRRVTLNKVVEKTGRRCISKTRLGSVGTVEMFHSSAKTPEASLHPLKMDFRIVWQMVECLTLTGHPPLVKTTYAQRHGSKMTSMLVKHCLWHSDSAMKRLRCTRPTEPRFGITMATRVKTANT